MSQLISRYSRKIFATHTSLFALSDNKIWQIHDSGPIAPVLYDFGNITDFIIHNDKIIFVSDVQGNLDLFTFDRTNPPKRLTFWSTRSLKIAGFDDQHVFVSSSYKSCNPVLYSINPITSHYQRTEWGCNYYAVFFSKSHTILQRNGHGYSSWRNYQGGYTGQLWIARNSDQPTSSHEFTPLLSEDSGYYKYNALNPLIHNDRVYFLSDATGIGNIHSCDCNGQNTRQETHCTDFYVRSFAFYNNKLLYISGGQIYEQQSTITKHLPLATPTNLSSSMTLQKEFPCSSLSINKDHQIALTSRSQLYKFSPSSCSTYNNRSIEYVAWLNDKELLAVESDMQTKLYKIDQTRTFSEIATGDIGIVMDITPAPNGKMACISTNRHELHLYNAETDCVTLLPAETGRRILDASWSSDSKYIAHSYSPLITDPPRIIRLHDVESQQFTDITPPQAQCKNPIFDEENKYLTYIRETITTEDDYPYATSSSQSICLALLHPETLSPLTGLGPEKLDSESASNHSDSVTPNDTKNPTETKGSPEVKKLALNLPELAQNLWLRTELIPLSTKASLLKCSAKGIILLERESKTWSLKLLEWLEEKPTTLIENIQTFTCDASCSWIAYFSLENKLISCKLGEKPTSTPARKDSPGIWELPRITLNPLKEWRVILTQAWHAMKEYFYKGEPTLIDWEAIHAKYLTLISTISSRSDLNELIWELHGELCSSHAYITNPGDIKIPDRTTTPGDLGAEITWDGTHWILQHVYNFNSSFLSPLARFNLSPGTRITHIDDQLLCDSYSPDQALLGKVNTNVKIKTQSSTDLTTQTFYTRALAYDTQIYYYAWRENTRKQVPQHIGYIHIPDMASFGVKEFWQQYLHEYDKDGIILDIRHNGGGNASGVILSHLIGTRLGKFLSRYNPLEHYLPHAPKGPIVLLIDGRCGSDGDIFAASFLALKKTVPHFGPVIGESTWGGVIGMADGYVLSDGGRTTQPEAPTWFKGVGFGLENSGVHPDIYVVNAPGEEFRGIDSQLTRGIVEVQTMIDRKNAL